MSIRRLCRRFCCLCLCGIRRTDLLTETLMQRREALKLFAGLALCPLCASAGSASEGHWSYDGATGPERWGGLDAEDAVCSAGGQQSPIDISAPINARQPPLRMNWNKRPDTIVNNGHTVQSSRKEHAPDG